MAIELVTLEVGCNFLSLHYGLEQGKGSPQNPNDALGNPVREVTIFAPHHCRIGPLLIRDGQSATSAIAKVAL